MKALKNINLKIKSTPKYLLFLFGILIFAYVFIIISTFKNTISDVSYIFGYQDYQHHWRLLDSFTKLKMPFKDYFLLPSHGWFYLFYQSLPFILFNKTFFAELIIRYLYLPVTGVILSILVAKNILRKKHLILIFLTFCFLFGVNYKFESPRHLISEFSLSLFVVYLLGSKTKYLFLSGITAGLAILTSLEYGIALNLTVLGLFFISLFSDINIKKTILNRFLVGELIILIPFYSWLLAKGLIKNYWDYSFGFINNFYYSSPCSSNSFPRIGDIKALHDSSNLLIFNIPIELLKGLNFYFVPIFYLISVLCILYLFILKRKFSKFDLIKLSILIYGVLIYIRTLDTPCEGYFAYGLIPFFLLVTLFIEKLINWSHQKKSLILKKISLHGVFLIFIWFILTENTGYLIKFFNINKTAEISPGNSNEFYPPIGWYLKTEYVKQYEQITNYIFKNTKVNDYVYVYPWGVYNMLSGRKRPNSIPTALTFTAGEKFILLTKKELEEKKPKLVIINIYNNLGIAYYGKTREDVPRFFSVRSEDGPVFMDKGNEVEKYILENYKTVLTNDLAIVLEPRDTPLKLKEQQKEVSSWIPGQSGKIMTKSMRELKPGQYKISGKNASWTLILKKPITATAIYMELKLDGDFLTKHLTRYFFNFYVSENEEIEGLAPVVQGIATKDWQTIKIFFSKPNQIKSVKAEIGKNTGLLWLMNPNRLEIKKLTFYYLNSINEIK